MSLWRSLTDLQQKSVLVQVDQSSDDQLFKANTGVWFKKKEKEKKIYESDSKNLSYVFNDNELVDVGELCVNKLPQRLLLVSLRLCHNLTRKRRRKRQSNCW